MRDARHLVIADIQTMLPDRCRSVLYDVMLDYPLRAAKALRPALCIAICRALGGRLEDVLRPAAVIELYHNAFLVHDDIEDGAKQRRGQPALHRKHGIPIAINVGDGMLALANRSLRSGMTTLDREKRDKVHDIIDQMGIETAEGQALELAFMRWGRFKLNDRDYLRLVYKKTCWYSFVAPLLVGATIANVPADRMAPLRKLGAYLGVAFQIHDDVLNLTAASATYDKDLAGDLKEGKCTLILMHALRCAAPLDRGRCEWILRKRPDARTKSDLAVLTDLIHRHGSIDYARTAGTRAKQRAAQTLETTRQWLPASTHRDFISDVLEYVTHRDR